MKESAGEWILEQDLVRHENFIAPFSVGEVCRSLWKALSRTMASSDFEQHGLGC